MNCQRRFFFLLLGMGACLMLVLETMDLWTYSAPPNLYSRFHRIAEGNSTAYLNGDITYEGTLANGSVKEDPVTNTYVNKIETLNTTSVPGPLNHTFTKIILDPVSRTFPEPVPNRLSPTIPEAVPGLLNRAFPEPVRDHMIRTFPKVAPGHPNRTFSKPIPDSVNRTFPKPVSDYLNLTFPGPVPDHLSLKVSQPAPDHQNRTFPKRFQTTRNQQEDASFKKQNQVSLLKFLSPEQILRNMSNSLVGAQVQSPKTTRHVLLVSYFRGGSTFMGDLLQQNWKTFYTFEPLHLMSDGLRINDTQLDEALLLLRDLMYCNFSSSRSIKYLEWATESKNNFLMYHNKFLYLTCSRNLELCFRQDFLEYLCNRAPWQVMKLNRLSMEQVGRFVQENPDLDIRVLHLVRDPRGIISSRKVMSWCQDTACGDIKVLCNEMKEDYKAFQRLKKHDPQRFFQLRYEDIASQPTEISKQVFEALDLPYTKTITRFLNRNTKSSSFREAKNLYSTKRNSYKTAFEWRNKLRLDEIKNVQAGCANVLINYDYLLVNSSWQLVGSPQKLYSSQKSWIRR